MNFMVETQEGDLVQVRHFIKADLECTLLSEIGIRCFADSEISWLQEYPTPERRDEVMLDLRFWIAQSLKIAQTRGHNCPISSIAYNHDPIFTFPKE